jgi:hypothetical protein
VTSRLPWRTFPGSKWRKEAADYLYQKLGNRFAAFGNGWDGPYAHGAIPFTEQWKAYHAARIAIGINNLHAAYYFSDRFPICLSTGVIMVHNYEQGIDEVFRDVGYPYFFQTTEQAWSMIESLLRMSDEELDSLAKVFKQFSLERLSIKCTLQYMIEVLKDYKTARETGAPVYVRPNLWIKAARF